MTGNGLRSFGSTCLLVCSLGLGCGGDDDGGGVSTGLPTDQKLSELGEEDLMMACEAVADSLSGVINEDESRRIDCTAASFAASVVVKDGKPQGDVAKCKMLVNECLAKEPDPETNTDDSPIDTSLGGERDCSTENTGEQFEGCSATVGEYESCLNAALAAINDLFSAINCDALANPEEVMDRFGNGFAIEELPACEGLLAKCPSIELGGDDEAESSAP